jgi:hypothetical protein
VHLIFFDLFIPITNYEAHRYAVFSTFLHPLYFGPYIFLSTLFSNTLSLCSSLKVRDQAVKNLSRCTDL